MYEKTTVSQVNTMYDLMLLPERLERQMEEGPFEVQNADRICISFFFFLEDVVLNAFFVLAPKPSQHVRFSYSFTTPWTLSKEPEPYKVVSTFGRGWQQILLYKD